MAHVRLVTIKQHVYILKMAFSFINVSSLYLTLIGYASSLYYCTHERKQRKACDDSVCVYKTDRDKFSTLGSNNFYRWQVGNAGVYWKVLRCIAWPMWLWLWRCHCCKRDTSEGSSSVQRSMICFAPAHMGRSHCCVWYLSNGGEDEDVDPGREGGNSKSDNIVLKCSCPVNCFVCTTAVTNRGTILTVRPRLWSPHASKKKIDIFMTVLLTDRRFENAKGHVQHLNEQA